jgi:kynureninase
VHPSGADLPDSRLVISRDDALKLDRADLLAPYRDRFVIPDDRVAYLDGNSLGRTPKTTIERVNQVMLQEWAGDLISSWDHWVHLPSRIGDRLAPLIGAQPGEVIVHDSTTVNIYQAVQAAIALRPDRRVIAIHADDFPTDRYVVDGIAARTGHQVRHGFDHLDDVAVVLRSLVDYRTAEIADLHGETARADAAGAITVWDLSHAAGVLAVDLGGAGVQLAVGCTYKFLNGGPGAPAFSYVRTDLQATLPQPIWGWWAHTDMFAMGPTFIPHPDARRVLLGTASVLSLVAAEEGIALSAEAGIGAIQTKARSITSFAIDLCDELALRTPSPRDPMTRGGHVAVQHPDARQLVTTMAAEGIVTDFREPDIVRIGCSPLTTRYVDVYDCLCRIAELTA